MKESSSIRRTGIIIRKKSVEHEKHHRIDIIIKDENGIEWGVQVRPKFFKDISALQDKTPRTFQFRNEFSEQYNYMNKRTYFHNNLNLEKVE